MFVYGDIFLALVRNFRVVHISGRYGGGKTLLSVAIAKHLLETKTVDYVFTNFPCSLHNFDSNRLVNTCIILDESWLTLFSGVSFNVIRSYLAFMRKLNNYLLLPSVLPLSKQVTLFEVSRFLDLSIFGLPVWIYRWKLRTTKEKGYFALLFPSSYFNLYDHSFAPVDDGGLRSLLEETVRWYQEARNE